MYALLQKYLPIKLCDWIMALWFTLLIILTFVLWDTSGSTFHYLEL